MKEITGMFIAAACLLMVPGYARAQGGPPSESTLASGFKQALSIGTGQAVKMVSKTDGYFGNQAIKILLPDQMKVAADALGKIGMQKQVDDFTREMIPA